MEEICRKEKQEGLSTKTTEKKIYIYLKYGKVKKNANFCQTDKNLVVFFLFWILILLFSFCFENLSTANFRWKDSA